MKKSLALVMALVLTVSLCFGCASNTAGDILSAEQAQAEASGLKLHKIGVATYSIKDAQVRMFKDYLDHYIKECFSDVTFLYSDSITGSEELMEFLALCADNGAEGVMVFGSYDLQKEVEFCADHGMYYIRPSATASDAEFNAVASNPYFVGEIGPGIQNEYEEAAKMTRALAAEGKQYVVLSSGASAGNEMHRLRTVAILDTLQEIYGVTFDQSSDILALEEEPTLIETGGLKLIISPGYLEMQTYCDAAAEIIASGAYTTVLSVVPITPLLDALDTVDIECGVIDCFSEENYYGFKQGRITYLAGKYQSEIGPGFAALYNAITGNADAYRVDGRAFRLVQGFWTAANVSEYDTKYALACGTAVNAYNYEDLYSVVKRLNPDANFEIFKDLVEAWSYEDCAARRSE